ncbi:carboxypeptidase-like regulatory domain-containing protein [Haloarcula marina]|uniref:carboxypeptidase-like regulatory domain-containing protein n=1 Tax=Haloarcula marina TaxID=2961574 RepID=UPI0020B6CCF9|nr:carboxypeptidase-like regulatory domain-containing protein [Halomicroarcula marina]
MARSRLSIALCVVALTGTLALAFTGGAAAQQEQTTLTVTVVDQNGDPVGDVDLSATWDGGEGGPVNETTRSNGQALVDVPEGADVTIRVTDDEYIRNQPFTVENASARTVEIDVARTARARITVRDTAGEAVSDARVQLYSDGRFITDQRTRENGTVRTPEIESGEYRLVVSKDGFFRNRTQVTIRNGATPTATLEEGSALVTVTVTDDHFEEPQAVRNASVTVSGAGTVQTLSNGQATISVPVNDDYDLRVTKDEYETADRRLVVREDNRSIDVTIRRTPSLSLVPDNQRVVVGETVRLRLTDEYGDTVGNVNVTQDGAVVGTTDESGMAVVPVESAGNVTFEAASDGLSTTATVEGVEPAAEETPTETATPTATATASPTATPTATTTTGGGGPGFTTVTVLLAVAALALLALRRR